MLSYTGPYSRDLMNRVLLGLGPPAAHYNSTHEEPALSWEERVCGQPLAFSESSSILSDVVNRLDQRPIGWLPPLYPLPHHHIDENLPPTPSGSTSPAYRLAHTPSPHYEIPTTPDLLEFDTFDYRFLDIRQDGVDSSSSSSNSSSSTGSTPASSVFARTPSPFVPATESNIKSIRSANDENSSPELSPLLALRDKEREKIRQGSGVKPKTKFSRTHGRRSADGASSSHPSLEMVQCQWADCTKRLYVDYINVRHWGQHVREHYAKQPEMIQCKWEGGCGAMIHKSSMWKHIVVHQPKFKIRCPRGCGVLTRGDMMRRHLQSCSYSSRRAAKKGRGEEDEDMEVEESSSGGDSDYNGEDDEGERGD